jgi:epoxyqueuosine reductase
MPTSISEHTLSGPQKTRLREQALAEGFDDFGVVGADIAPHPGERLHEFLALDRQGDMTWLADKASWRQHPNSLWPEARSIIMLGLNYGPETDPMAGLTQRSQGVISTYARRKDYHDVVKKKLKRLARWLISEHGGDVKVFVDTAPVMEKPLAELAGLGWQGKHTNLLSREFGSWLFLGSIFTTLSIPEDDQTEGSCGSCRACLDICPTDAFPAPYQLDARRCISYLTIETRTHIERELRPLIGNRIYGCDDCLAVCPWNKYAQTAHEVALAQRPELEAPRLLDLVALDDQEFRSLFTGSPIKRLGRNRFIRNVLIAIGNSADGQYQTAVQNLLEDPSPIIRVAAIWALARISTAAIFDSHKQALSRYETDPDVIEEWNESWAQIHE